jgi:hypothetical protein
MRRLVSALVGIAVCVATLPARARADNLDFQLWRLGAPADGLFYAQPNADKSMKQVAVPFDPRAQERYARFVTDLAFAITPIPSGLSSSAGDAGLDVSLSLEFAFTHPNQKFSDGTTSFVWPTASAAPQRLLLPTLHLRKGLPLSFQIGTDVAYVVGSSLFVPTVWASWSILEGHRWVPDLHIRGLCTVLLGAQDMVLVVGGWDVGTSYRIPIAGRAELGLYAGYQQLGISSSTQNINFDPQHQSSQALSADSIFAPLSYGSPISPTTRMSRVYFGTQVRVAMAVLGVDVVWGTANNPIGDGLATHYSLTSWKFGLRAGLMF